MKATLLIILLLMAGLSLDAQDSNYKTVSNVHYYSDEINRSDNYINERCVLDIYYPTNKKGFSTVVWFHGGGLSQGHKEIPQALKNKGICVIGVNYRLHPKVKSPKYVEDAAAAVAWTIKNIHRYGGDSTLVFVSGHSAGGYLTSMVGLDKHWLAKFHVDANQIAGLIPFSGHTITHFTIRDERGIPGTQPIVDEMAPLYHVRPDAPPLLLITGDRELEMLGRYEENAYLMRMMKVVGHTQTRLYELDGYGHGMTEPAFPLLLKEVARITQEKHVNAPAQN
ncbi:alpha/beta hydrolase [Thermophagus sp. OGC60D27]|uniref:alpha/beta hydrolase n=1 Tax=Thermophagus sp. OGC60D27 TaxID=3458415 RepID=UPI0040378A06